MAVSYTHLAGGLSTNGIPTEASPAIRKTIAVFVYGVIPPKIKDLRNETRQFYPHNLKSNEPD